MFNFLLSKILGQIWHFCAVKEKAFQQHYIFSEFLRINLLVAFLGLRHLDDSLRCHIWRKLRLLLYNYFGKPLLGINQPF
jgi:hypothetical protein